MMGQGTDPSPCPNVANVANAAADTGGEAGTRKCQAGHLSDVGVSAEEVSFHWPAPMLTSAGLDDGPVGGLVDDLSRPG